MVSERGGNQEVVSGSTEFLPSAALPKQQSLAAIGFHGTLFLSSTSFSFEIAKRFLSCQLGQC